MLITINGVERVLSPELTQKLMLICNERSCTHADMVLSAVEVFIDSYPLQRYCDHCGCKLQKYLGDLVFHNGDCPNVPF